MGRTSNPGKMSFQDSRYLSSIKGAQAFIKMDPNLLRFPEVVLERIQIKIEEDLSPSINTDGEDEQEPERQEEKEEEWPNKKQEMQNGEASCYANGGSSLCRGRGRSSKKEHRKDAVRAGHRFGFNGSMNEMERGGGHRRGGKKRRGGWHHFAIRDRQQFQRKRKKHTLTYVEEERQRGQRFSEEENEALVVNVLIHYRDLCGHSAIKGSATRKRRLWQDVADEVNSVATTYRTIEVCKKRYGDCRRAVRLKMAALEQQAQGRGDPNEQIRFNSWEEKLRQKISSLMSGGQQVLDTCEPTTLELASCSLQEALGSILCPSWNPPVDTAACSVLQPGETFSEGEEATSPLDVQIVQIHNERMEAPGPPAEPTQEDGGGHNATGPEPAYHQLQEECSSSGSLRYASHQTELHKLRENVVEGNRRMAQHLEGLASEVRELNAHVRQIHMNQTHFNHMFQNYLSDTKQFYGAMVQAMRNLQPPPAVSPMASAASSPVPSPRPTLPNPLLLTAMPDYTTPSPAGSAEPASAASSTASELPLYARRPSFRPPKNH